MGLVNGGMDVDKEMCRIIFHGEEEEQPSVSDSTPPPLPLYGPINRPVSWVTFTMWTLPPVLESRVFYRQRHWRFPRKPLADRRYIHIHTLVNFPVELFPSLEPAHLSFCSKFLPELWIPILRFSRVKVERTFTVLLKIFFSMFYALYCHGWQKTQKKLKIRFDWLIDWFHFCILHSVLPRLTEDPQKTQNTLWLIDWLIFSISRNI